MKNRGSQERVPVGHYNRHTHRIEPDRNRMVLSQRMDKIADLANRLRVLEMNPDKKKMLVLADEYAALGMNQTAARIRKEWG